MRICFNGWDKNTYLYVEETGDNAKICAVGSKAKKYLSQIIKRLNSDSKDSYLIQLGNIKPGQKFKYDNLIYLKLAPSCNKELANKELAINLTNYGLLTVLTADQLVQVVEE